MKEKMLAVLTECVRKAAGLEVQELPAFSLEVPAQKSHGDLATNVAMVLAKQLKRAPRSIASPVAELLSNEPDVEKVEIAGPGFINIFIRPEAWRRVLEEVLSAGLDYGRSRPAVPERILVEFVSANPTGPLHFGHGRGAVVGDVLASLLEVAGHEVEREYYVNDAGGQVRALALSLLHRINEQRGIASRLPEDGYKGEYVTALARRVPQELLGFLPGAPGEPDLKAIQDFAVSEMLAAIRDDLGAFGVSIGRFTSERALVAARRVEETLADLEKRGLIEERDGARWFLSDRFGDEKPRVLVKQDGSLTYFASDVAYHWDKLRRGARRLINVWGADHHGYIPRMKASLQALGYPPEALEVVLVQMVRLVRDGVEVKMSKREGEIVTLREVVDEVGRDAARFFFLLRSAESQMDFDMELAKRRTLDNPVFYVQYGHARLSSILRKALERNIPIPDPAHAGEVDLRPLELPEELGLIKRMALFPDEIRRAAHARAPHLLVFWVQELVADFHRYYTASCWFRPCGSCCATR